MTEKALRDCFDCERATTGIDYVLGDIDDDGHAELLVKGRDETQSSLLISGWDDGQL